jgi:hypothetical protein
MTGSKVCAVIAAALGLTLSAARGADVRCDTPGVAQLLIPDAFAQNPGAKNLDLEATSVKVLSVDEHDVRNPVCVVSVETNHKRSLRYRFGLSPDGTVTLDLVP